MNRSLYTISNLFSQNRNKQFSISLIEDNQFYLKGIVQHMKQNIPNIKLNAFSRSSSFLKSLRHKPEIAIVDFNLDDNSEMAGIELIRELKFKSPKTKIIILTGEKSISTAIKCLNEGVMDYVIKEDKAIDKIADEIKTVMRTMVSEMEKDAFHKRIQLLITLTSVVVIGLITLKLFYPRLFI